jgi:acetyltransferase-like isoleucine patch superfamily enzyme
VTGTDLERLLRKVDASRRSLGFLEVGTMVALADRGIHLLDPFSILISPQAEIEPGAVLSPIVVLDIGAGGAIHIGAGTRLFSGTHIRADGGTVSVGRRAEIGADGGFSLKASAGIAITVGHRARLTGGGILSENCDIGDGAQVLGRIDVRACRLAGGGAYDEADPDRRGAVLKGFGQARNIRLARGQVIQGFGLFSEAEVRMQSFFHPRADTGISDPESGGSPHAKDSRERS